MGRTITSNNVNLGSIEAPEESSESHHPFLNVCDVFDGVLGLFNDLGLGSTVIGGKRGSLSVSKSFIDKTQRFALQ